MEENQRTDKLEMAARFVNTTGVPIFLTGKAGTGKTTFLRNLTKSTYKNVVVVAPTGIAALHAKGVTIHSQFLLPLGSFLPVREPEGNFTSQHGFFTQHTLGRKHPLNNVRKGVLKSLDLLVIDEVSMLRADILDAIDYRMRSARRNFREPFGGAQVLLIGDLYQLPPIVREQEWPVLNQFYNSMHFFEAKALQESGLVYLELDKIFRQKDETFIALLNHLRDNRLETKDVELLQSYYRTDKEVEGLSDIITITTHNYRADQINKKMLESISSPSRTYEAEVKGDFPDSLYPLSSRLEIKTGARIMFVRNDSGGEGEYYNGKLATVSETKNSNITVKDDDGVEFMLKKETWENKKYVINPDTKELDEDVVGTFEHYPIKLAWAVTVHKSQGLTFEKAIIDVGQAFVPGQVYVALSRLRSLDGLILRSRINIDMVFSDSDVVGFTQRSNEQLQLHSLLVKHQENYLNSLVEQTYNFWPLLKLIEEFQKEHSNSMVFEDPQMQEVIPSVHNSLVAERGNTEKFRAQLHRLLANKDENTLKERLEKGTGYYQKLLFDCLRKVLTQKAMVANFSWTKSYQKGLDQLEENLIRKYKSIGHLPELMINIIEGNIPERKDKEDQAFKILHEELIKNAKAEAAEKVKLIKSKTGRKKEGAPKLKQKKGDSLELTLALFESGKKIPEIADERGLAESTIKGHLAKGIEAGRVALEDCLTEEVINEIRKEFGNFENLGELKEHFGGKYDYGTLKMVLAGSEVEK
ncbi:helix-turn-helix domain-containing protein [Echinicola jeungdonensis]|uniref:Helix-turn-helix domain-containing protein n=1 Tax=Echinicola jeungdonensis TaxID=709343 RepID=A0ABV5JBH2_9BACT|nr:helix-turn-helix domain-containing protein [Echinicola jeungdonensis]MDN3670231.1 helix-turn-helix domain-containing protein [Echinicola jeungdonensis]